MPRTSLRMTGMLANRAARFIISALCVLLSLAARPAWASNDCQPDWTIGQYCLPGIGAEEVRATVYFDDGSGPALYVAGTFAVAGCAAVSNIARWDGTRWSALGSGLSGTVHVMTVFDDGSGPALYVGGRFISAGGQAATSIARWDGSDWFTLDSGLVGIGIPVVHDMAVFDDGSGPALYVGGFFSSAGGLTVNHIARWDGLGWSALGTGVSSTVHTILVHDDGSGPAIYIGGAFARAGALDVNYIARWDGAQWSSLDIGMDSGVLALAVFDDGSGSALIAGGQFTVAGTTPARRVARWDGSDWSPIGSGFSAGSVYTLRTFNLDGTTVLVAGGATLADAPRIFNHIAQWDGNQWSSMAGGVGGTGPFRVNALIEDHDTNTLLVGGRFTTAGGITVNRIARWDGFNWSPIVRGFDRTIDALALHDRGDGLALYAGGSFTQAPGINAARIARWDGADWFPLDVGLGGSGSPVAVRALVSHDDGSGPSLFAAGAFTTAGDINAARVARWDGQQWFALGSGFQNQVYALCVFNDGSGDDLYAGGLFTTAGGVTVNRIARWNGSVWSPLNSGVNGTVSSLAVFDDGNGPALYAGGSFTTASGIQTGRIARWDGFTWSALGTGVSTCDESVCLRVVESLAVFDDGSGPALYVGGSFASAGNLPDTQRLARWDGSNWSSIGKIGDCIPSPGSGCLTSINAMAVFDDGSGPALYIGGHFGSINNMPIANLARWDGSNWSPLGNGIHNTIRALHAWQTPSNRTPTLAVGGSFASAGNSPSAFFATWQGCNPACLGDLNKDDIVDVFDMALFFAWFAAGDPRADLNNDGILDFFDVQAFLNAFAAGCP